MLKKLVAICVLVFLMNVLYGQKTTPGFRVGTVTAGITLKSLSDTATLNAAIEFLKSAKQAFIDKGYEKEVRHCQ